MVGNRRGGASTRVGELLRRVAAFSFVVIAGSAFAAEPNDSQILYFEPLRLNGSSPTQQPATQQKGSSSRELHFGAYGRRFVVSLQTNEKLSPLLQSKTGVTTPVQLFKGQVNGIAGSWARIARKFPTPIESPSAARFAAPITRTAVWLSEPPATPLTTAKVVTMPSLAP